MMFLMGMRVSLNPNQVRILCQWIQDFTVMAEWPTVFKLAVEIHVIIRSKILCRDFILYAIDRDTVYESDIRVNQYLCFFYNLSP